MNKTFNEYVPSKKISSFTSEPYQTSYSNGHYFALGEYSDGTIQVSENKTIDTMHLAQNWIAKKENVNYE